MGFDFSGVDHVDVKWHATASKLTYFGPDISVRSFVSSNTSYQQRDVRMERLSDGKATNAKEEVTKRCCNYNLKLPVNYIGIQYDGTVPRSCKTCGLKFHTWLARPLFNKPRSS